MDSQNTAALAKQAADSERERIIVMRTKELGVFNDKTRDLILSEANKAARAAQLAVYFIAGYTECGCGSLVNPNFARCFSCGAWKKQTTNDTQLRLAL